MNAKKKPAPRADAMAARRCALRVLLKAEAGDSRFEAAFDRETRTHPLSRKDRSLAHTLAAGTMKLKRKLDFYIDQLVEPRHRPLPDAIQYILRLGIFQLIELSRVPRHAAVSTSVDLAKQWGHVGTARLVNAVLRRVADHDPEWPWPRKKEEPLLYLATFYSYPDWMVERWISEYGFDEAERFCQLGNGPGGLTLRLVRGRRDLEPVRKQLRGMGCESEPGRWFGEYLFLPDPPPVRELRVIASGEATIQNEAAAAATYLLEPQPGDTIWDVGAAPGGKSTHLAEWLGADGTVAAVDINPRRMKRVLQNVKRMQLERVMPVLADGLHLPARGVAKILLDTPCSSLGLVHRHPDLRWQKQLDDITRLAALQHDLLNRAADALAPGGRVVYSTCTTTREENEGVIARVLENRDDLTVVDPRPLLPEGVPATPHWVVIAPDPPQLDAAFACALQKIA